MSDRPHDHPDLDRYPELTQAWDRRKLHQGRGDRHRVHGGRWLAGPDRGRRPDARGARAEKRPDGRPRLPPGQRMLEYLRPMGGDEGDGDAQTLQAQGPRRGEDAVRARLRRRCSSCRRSRRRPTSTASPAGRCSAGCGRACRSRCSPRSAGMKGEARHVIFEAAHGYTANVPLKEAIADNALITYRLNGKPFALQHGAPVRGLVPDLYFWKSAKWITGVRFVKDDKPGYWEVRGYHNHADPVERRALWLSSPTRPSRAASSKPAGSADRQEALARLAARDPPRLRLPRRRLHGHLRGVGHRDQPHRRLGSELHVVREDADDRADPGGSPRRRGGRAASPTAPAPARPTTSIARATRSGSTTRTARRSPRSATPARSRSRRARRGSSCASRTGSTTTAARRRWTYIADVYAVLLLYLAISGIFMIKGRLGLRWRGAILISLGVGVPAHLRRGLGRPERRQRDHRGRPRGGARAPTRR